MTFTKILFCMILLMGVFIFPATADTDTQFLPTTYIPYQYEVLLISMGFGCWILMRYAQELEVLFGLLAILIFGASAWLAAYVSMNETFYDGTTVMYSQLITPQPILQVVLVVCFLFAIIIELYVWVLRDADKKTNEGLAGTRPIRKQ